MRSRPHGKSIQIIAVTGWGQKQDRERSREAGVDLHMVKPVDPGALLQMLNRHIDDAESTR
jgi:CheY-like chemotaxis protein